MEEAKAMASLQARHSRSCPLYPWAPGAKTRYVRVRPASVTGRRITIPDDLPFTWWG